MVDRNVGRKLSGLSDINLHQNQRPVDTIATLTALLITVLLSLAYALSHIYKALIRSHREEIQRHDLTAASHHRPI